MVWGAGPLLCQHIWLLTVVDDGGGSVVTVDIEMFRNAS
jgi:hypothetical protein